MGRHNFHCASINFSRCTQYTGKQHECLGEFECDVNLDEYLEKVGDAICALQSAVDIHTLQSTCITLPNPKTIVGSFQAINDKVCALQAIITALQTQVANINIANNLINIDLKCLSAAAAPCAVATNQYSLISILNLLVTQICAIKTHLGI